MAVIIKGQPKVDSALESDITLWRYMNLAKFLDLIRSNSLYFSRGDTFSDKFEGSFTQSLKNAIKSAYNEHNIDFTYEEFKQRLHQRVYVNCWHLAKDDNMAMWYMYGCSENAVAVTTTVGQLRDCIKLTKLNHNIFIKKIKYIKHWRNPKLDINPYSNVFSYKVKSYEFEKEVRVIIDRFAEDFDIINTNRHMLVPISINNLINNVIVAPESSERFFDTIQDVSKKYQLNAPVARSKLAVDPI